jgi:hypothetical protein
MSWESRAPRRSGGREKNQPAPARKGNTGRPRKLLQRDVNNQPDGKRILVNQTEPTSGLDLVMNWPLLLRGQAAQ